MYFPGTNGFDKVIQMDRSLPNGSPETAKLSTVSTVESLCRVETQTGIPFPAWKCLSSRPLTEFVDT